MFMSCNKTGDRQVGQEPGARVWRESECKRCAAQAPLCWHMSVGLSHAASPHPGHPRVPVWHLLPGQVLREITTGCLDVATSKRVECMHSMERRGGST